MSGLIVLGCVVALVALWAPPRTCATCACNDPALIGAGRVRPSAGRAIVDGLAIDVQVPLVVAQRVPVARSSAKAPPTRGSTASPWPTRAALGRS